LGGLNPQIRFPLPIEESQLDNRTELLKEKYRRLSDPAERAENITPFVSIVIPVHIRESRKKFLMSVMSLLAAEDIPSLEIIIVINGKISSQEIRETDIFRVSSNIGFKTIALSFNEDERYKDIRRPKNIFEARQTGSEKARGDIIISGDIDNIFSAYLINAYAEAFRKNQDLLIAYGPVGFYGTINAIGKLMSWISTLAKAAKILINYPPFAGHNHAMRAEVIQRVPGLYSERILVHENEIPTVLEKTLHIQKGEGYITCVPDAIILTNFGKQKQSVKGAVEWFTEALMRNIGQIRRLKGRQNGKEG
jgi:glycosyltransferase involved in cell wall biosynthesis